MPFQVPKVDARLHAALNAAIEQWVTLTGVDPESKAWKGWNEYDVHKTYDQINECQKLDPTGLSTAMALRAFVQNMANDVAFTAREILEEPEQVDKTISQMRQLVRTLEAPAITQPTAAFIQWLKAGAAHYSAVNTDALLADPYELAFLRRDALRAVEELRAHQFLYGEPSPDEIKYNDSVFQHWNVNSFLRTMTRLPSGVYLSLIRDVEAVEYSYFVFGIRNGGNMYILTDKDQHAHPLQKYMMRRPDREFKKRAFAYHFPYQLMEYELREKAVHIPKQEGLVRYNQEAIVLGKLVDLEPDQILWLVMVLALVYERYWREGKQLPTQSYTGEMVAIPAALTREAQNLPVKITDALEFPRLTLQDITTNKLIKAKQWRRKPTRHNQWLADRYSSTMPEAHLNLLQREDLPQLPTCWGSRGYLQHDTHQLRGLAPVEFGTAEELRRDAEWTARYNLAVHVNSKALEEFEEKHDEVLTWYKERLEANVPALLEGVARLEFMATACGRHPTETFDHSYEQPANILSLEYPKPGYTPTNCRGAHWLSPWDRQRGIPRCRLTGTTVSIYAHFRVETPHAIARVTDCAVKNLPIFLQHYCEEPYYGNQILDRLDPMDWIVNNPWWSLGLNVAIALSKRGFNQLRHQHELPIFHPADWAKLKKTDE